MGITIVAIDVAPEDRTSRVEALAAALGANTYQAERHLLAPGPRVLATYGALDRAQELAAVLHTAGFPPIVLDAEDARMRFAARAFAFDGRTLRVSDRGGETLHVAFADIEAFVRGVRAGASADEREPYLDVWVPGRPVLALREGALQYDGLRLERQPTAAANFSWLVRRLRTEAPQAVYDERLNTRAAQLRVLGEVLTPEAHLEIASTLLARSMRRLRTAA
jgi:hypothetical protein